jgi:hypothetical protein
VAKIERWISGIRRLVWRVRAIVARAVAPPVVAASSTGPPVDWIERVRRGAPHLLTPGPVERATVGRGRRRGTPAPAPKSHFVSPDDRGADVRTASGLEPRTPRPPVGWSPRARARARSLGWVKEPRAPRPARPSWNGRAPRGWRSPPWWSRRTTPRATNFAPAGGHRPGRGWPDPTSAHTLARAGTAAWTPGAGVPFVSRLRRGSGSGARVPAADTTEHAPPSYTAVRSQPWIEPPWPPGSGSANWSPTPRAGEVATSPWPELPALEDHEDVVLVALGRRAADEERAARRRAEQEGALW